MIGPDRHSPFPVVLNSNSQGNTITRKRPPPLSARDSGDSEIQAGGVEPWSSPTLQKDDGIINISVTQETRNFKQNLHMCLWGDLFLFFFFLKYCIKTQQGRHLFVRWVELSPFLHVTSQDLARQTGGT